VSEGFFQLIDVFPEPCLLVSPDGVVRKANRAFLNLFEAKSRSIAGKSLFDLTTTDPEKTRQYLQLCSKNRSFVYGALAFVTLTGHQSFRCEGAAISITDSRRAELILLRLKPQQNAVAQFSLLNEKIRELTQEIRQRIAVEAALRQSEALFRELADAMPQIVWAARPDGTVDYLNRRWYELTGATEGHIEDRSWLAMLHPDDAQRVLDAWHESVRTGNDYQIECRFKFPQQDEYRWHLARALPVRNSSGGIIRWFGTATDIHDRKTA
jgi:PAS domain S-box-containing protein